MARSGYVAFAMVVVVMIVSFQEASALKCWSCSTDAENSAFCNDPFDASLRTDEQRRWSYVDCIAPPVQLHPYDESIKLRAVCKKVKQLVNDKSIVSRSCYWEKNNAPKDECKKNKTPSHITTVFCETCDTDGCNAV